MRVTLLVTNTNLPRGPHSYTRLYIHKFDTNLIKYSPTTG